MLEEFSEKESGSRDFAVGGLLAVDEGHQAVEGFAVTGELLPEDSMPIKEDEGWTFDREDYEAWLVEFQANARLDQAERSDGDAGLAAGDAVVLEALARANDTIELDEVVVPGGGDTGGGDGYSPPWPGTGDGSGGGDGYGESAAERFGREDLPFIEAALESVLAALQDWNTGRLTLLHWAYADTIEWASGYEMLEWLSSPWVNEITGYEYSPNFSGSFTTVPAAIAHYIFGQGAPKEVDFHQVFPAIAARDVPVVQYLAANLPNGTSIEVNEQFAYDTGVYSYWTSGMYIGHVNLVIDGTFSKDASGVWEMNGTIRSEPDIYDANASTHRDGWGEFATSLLASIPYSQDYQINIIGEHGIHLSSYRDEWYAPIQ